MQRAHNVLAQGCQRFGLAFVSAARTHFFQRDLSELLILLYFKADE